MRSVRKAAVFVTMHGFALNINTNSYFSLINPCGFKIKGANQKEMGMEQDFEGPSTSSIPFSLEMISGMSKTVYYSFCPTLKINFDSVYRENIRNIGGINLLHSFIRLKTGFRNKRLRDLMPETVTSASLVPQMMLMPEEFRRIAGLFRESNCRVLMCLIVTF